MSRNIIWRGLVGSAIVAGLVAAAPQSAEAAWHGGGGGGGFHGGGGGFHGGGFHGGGGGWRGGGWHGGGWGGGGWGGHGWWGGRGWGGVSFGFGYPGWYGYGWPGYGYYPSYYYPAAYAYPQQAYYPTPQQAPPAPRAAQAPAAQHSYNVFFDFDRSELTSNAAGIVKQAADSARNEGVTRIYVDGHTDTTGTGGYNQALSERRAETVRRALIADGIPANEIDTTGHGKGGQLVPTGDQVREAQNRRVEIVFGNANVASAAGNSEYQAPSSTQVATANCRDFQRTIMIDGHQQVASGTACQQSDGSWQIAR